jgi:hypothetical protein
MNSASSSVSNCFPWSGSWCISHPTCRLLSSMCFSFFKNVAASSGLPCTAAKPRIYSNISSVRHKCAKVNGSQMCVSLSPWRVTRHVVGSFVFRLIATWNGQSSWVAVALFRDLWRWHRSTWNVLAGDVSMSV